LAARVYVVAQMRLMVALCGSLAWRRRLVALGVEGSAAGVLAASACSTECRELISSLATICLRRRASSNRRW
jgi:hypothetical protein